jgi:phage terminase large subunit-like protein
VYEELWKKANPIVMTYAEGIKGLREEYQIALDVPEKMTDFLTKSMNIWVQQADNGYMDMEKWKLCEVDKIPFDLSGRDVYVGLDLSAKIDLTSVTFMFPILDNEIQKYVLINHSFIPKGKLAERIRVDKQPYDYWVRQKYLTLIDCEIVDQKVVMDYLINTCNENNWNINTICVDPDNGSLFMTTLSDMGYNVAEVWQSKKSLNDAAKGFREQVYVKNVIYLKNPLLTFAMTNARTVQKEGMIKIDKDISKKRIDPVDATLCAYKLAMFHKFDSLDLNKLITDDYLTSLGW